MLKVLLPSGLVVATVVLAACSSAAAPGLTPGPTTQAVANQSAPTVQALATQVAPTAQAVQTQSAPTVQALATQAAPIAATISAAPPVHVTSVNVSSQDSTVTLQNAGSQPVDLSSWSLQVGTARAQLPSGVDVAPGQSVTLHTTTGTSSGPNVYLGQDAQAVAGQLKPGVQIVLTNPAGSTVSSFVIPNS